MRKAHRRWGLRILLVPIALVFVFDFMIRNPASAPAAFLAVKYYLSDLATFSIFWILGFAHSDGAIAQLDRRARLEWAAIGAAGAFVWIQFVHPATMVVNDSYPLSLFVGIAWLGLFLAAEKWIGRATEHGALGPIVRWLGSRSITVYLWHPVAIVGAYWLRSLFFPTLPRLALLPLVFALVVVLAVMFGRIEDHSAGRPAQWWPGRKDPASLTDLGGRVARYLPRGLSPVRSMVIGAVVGVLVLGVLVPTRGVEAPAAASGSDGLALPPAPSKKPDQADFAGATSTAATTTAGSKAAPTGIPMALPTVGTAETAVTVAVLQPKVQAAIDAWRTAKGVAGAEMGVMLPGGAEFTVVSGRNADGSVLDPTKAFPITSITKTMTSAITLQLVKQGKIGLDDLLPEIKAVPGLPFVGKVTIRQILNHTAGIQPYDAAPGYSAAKSGPLTPETALALDLGLPLQWTPGSKVGYSNSGYLTLGLLDEQLTGQTYAQLLQARVFGPAGMTASSLNTVPSAGWSGFSAGGVDSTLEDLLGWGDALYRTRKILDTASLTQMLDVSNQFNTGLGAFPVCPCSTVNNVKIYSSIGHNGGQATLQWAPKQNIVVALNLTESLFTTHLTQADVATLLESVETATAG